MDFNNASVVWIEFGQNVQATNILWKLENIYLCMADSYYFNGMKIRLSVLLALVIVGCEVKKSTISPPNQKVNVTTVTMSGELLYNKYCDGCHTFKNLTVYKKEELEKIIPIMCKKIDQKYRIKLSDQERADLLSYTISISLGK